MKPPRCFLMVVSCEGFTVVPQQAGCWHAAQSAAAAMQDTVISMLWLRGAHL